MKWLRGALVIGTFAVLFVLENKRPLRRSKGSKTGETARNLAIGSLSGLVVYFLEKPVAEKLTGLVEKKNVGLLRIFRLPRILETAAAIVLLDYTLYLWHVLTHKVPALWNFHRIHHADPDLTSSTAVRFHFGEIGLSVAFRAGQILVIGVSPKALEIWQTLLFISIFFHHSNLRLPAEMEEKLGKFIMTPRLHGIHHSAEESEMNSNWSSGLSIWDLLHGTFRRDIRQADLRIGVKDFGDPPDLTLGKMLLGPFRKKWAADKADSADPRG
jgi:sterol desaturase/sphingolipid hydroxylase (fatty acid hydroxylase superfamily)